MKTIILTGGFAIGCLIMEFILSTVWKENEYEEIIITDYDEQSSEDSNG